MYTAEMRRLAREARRRRAIAKAAERGETWPRKKGLCGRPCFKIPLTIAYCLERIRDGEIEPEIPSGWQGERRRKYGMLKAGTNRKLTPHHRDSFGRCARHACL